MKKKILMVFPKYPPTFWSLEHTLNIVNKKALMPPLGLLTVAAMLPDDYEIKLIDMNVTKLKDADILWADMVFLSAMIVQKESFKNVIKSCNRLNIPVTAGGPYVTTSHTSIFGVDHFILGEAELIMPQYIHDFESGNLSKIYKYELKPDIKKTPAPKYDLINVNDYGSLALQFSRGCPFSCEFCDIIELFGREPRLKSPEQFIEELEHVYKTGFRGLIFIVDDNFIGHKEEVLKLLESISTWQLEKSFPFTFFTEASMNLASEMEILDLMVDCAFTMVFMGVETPDEETLISVNKLQNVKYNVFESIEIVQTKGIEVISGFILGFDSDTDDIFDRQISFIQKAGIPMAMIGIMIALPGTQLFKRLEKEGRILYETSGNNTNTFDMNFIPVMNKDKIITGYKKILKTIYSPKKYFERSLLLISRMPVSVYKKRTLKKNDLNAFFKSLLVLGFSRYGLSYFRFLIKVLIVNPRHFPLAVILSVNGYHFFKITKMTLQASEISQRCSE